MFSSNCQAINQLFQHKYLSFCRGVNKTLKSRCVFLLAFSWWSVLAAFAASLATPLPVPATGAVGSSTHYPRLALSFLWHVTLHLGTNFLIISSLQMKFKIITRMHSSRMRTALSSSRHGGSPPPRAGNPLDHPPEQKPLWTRHPLEQTPPDEAPP